MPRGAIVRLVLLCVAVGAAGAQAQDPPSPAASRAAMTTPDDLVVDLVLHEPAVRQPVSLRFDERGRLWVVQYLQYPHPAGLAIKSHDRYWRNVYDRVPPPPPYADGSPFRGASKITIHWDGDGDGTLERARVFVDGLSLVTSVAHGRGGVFVLAPPHLLFYADRDRDDRPDGAPEVLLEGFGIEDSHSVANSLQWGPDGWLYACQGSTVSGAIRRPGSAAVVRSMGQLIWRYHPERRAYEIFAEGGGNAFGLEIDAKGRLFSGHNGGDTRGFHYVQGGYYRKGFQKHGALSNRFAFGHFPAMQHAKVPRFTHTFTVNEGGALPAKYAGKLFAAAPLQHEVVLSERMPRGSTFETRDLGRALKSSNKWFRPVDVQVGPDGAVWIADWCDANVNHLKGHEGEVDKRAGRIWRLRGRGTAAPKLFDIGALDAAGLLARLDHDNEWHRRTALRVIADRRDADLREQLLTRLNGDDGAAALEALWGLVAVDALEDEALVDAMGHSDPHVRAWAVRLAGDSDSFSAEIEQMLRYLAFADRHAEVLSQVASTARRLPASDAIWIAGQLVARELLDRELGEDPHLPLLIWWALEAQVGRAQELVVGDVERKDPGKGLLESRYAREHLAGRLIRRLAAGGSVRDLRDCARLLRAVGAEDAQRLVGDLERALQDAGVVAVTAELTRTVRDLGVSSLPLGVLARDAAAIRRARVVIADSKVPAARRAQVLGALARVGVRGIAPLLADAALRGDDDESVRTAAFTALQARGDETTARRIIAAHDALPPSLRPAAQAMLASRASWSRMLLEAVGSGEVARLRLPREFVRRLSLHAERDPAIAHLIEKQWGALRGRTGAQLTAEIERHHAALDAGRGDPYRGRALYRAKCAACHRLFDEGGAIGPDLTSFDRRDTDAMLLAIVNPSAEIRAGFEYVTLTTRDARVVAGFLLEENAERVVIRDAVGQRHAVARADIRGSLRPMGASLMPELLIEDLTPDQVRSLFAYLRSSQPLNVK